MYQVDVSALRKKMVDCNIRTYTELALHSGIDRNTISKIFSNSVKPSTVAIEKLMIALKIQPEQVGPVFFSRILRE